VLATRLCIDVECEFFYFCFKSFVDPPLEGTLDVEVFGLSFGVHNRTCECVGMSETFEIISNFWGSSIGDIQQSNRDGPYSCVLIANIFLPGRQPLCVCVCMYFFDVCQSALHYLLQESFH